MGCVRTCRKIDELKRKWVPGIIVTTPCGFQLCNAFRRYVTILIIIEEQSAETNTTGS